MKRIKLLFLSLVLACSLLPALPAMAAENVFEDACKTPGGQNSSACQANTTSNPLTGPDGVITRVTSIVSFLAGAAAIIMLIVAGFMFVTSAGDAGKVASARQTALYAVVGIVIVVVAQGIVVFILNRL